MSHNLYQPSCKTELPPGTVVRVDGPHDRFGVVLKTEKRNENGTYVLLVRGTGKNPKSLHVVNSLIWKT